LTEASKDWYSPKQLYEMMVALSKGLEKTNAELAVTQTMIRDYNGLREKVDKCEERVTKICAQGQGGQTMWGYVVGGLGMFFALLSAVGVI